MVAVAVQGEAELMALEVQEQEMGAEEMGDLMQQGVLALQIEVAAVAAEEKKTLPNKEMVAQAVRAFS
jgi:hypothetical protein